MNFIQITRNMTEIMEQLVLQLQKVTSCTTLSQKKAFTRWIAMKERLSQHREWLYASYGGVKLHGLFRELQQASVTRLRVGEGEGV